MSINKSLVSLFKICQKYDTESKQFTKLSIVFGKMTFNNKLYMKFYNEYQENKKDVANMVYFKNTNIRKVLTIMSKEDKREAMTHLYTAFKTSKQNIMGQEEHKCSATCSHGDTMEKMLGNKKLKKLLKKKGVKQALESQLGKQFNMKGDDLENMLKSVMKDNLPEKEFGMLSSLMGNKQVKSIAEKLLNADNMEKLKTMFMNFIEREDIKDEVENLKTIFNEKKVMTLVSSLTEKLKDMKDLTDISGISGIIQGSSELKELATTFEKAMESGLISEDKINGLIQKAQDTFLAEAKNMGILDLNSINVVQGLLGGFGSSLFGPSKTMTREQKRERRQKDTRRRIREQLKAKKAKGNKRVKKNKNKKKKH